MATAVVMPKQGNSVESCIITTWKKAVGDAVKQGDVLCEVETDKAVLAVESPADGVVLARFYEAGADVPVMTHIAVIGEAGETFSEADFAPSQASPSRVATPDATAAVPTATSNNIDTPGLVNDIAHERIQWAESHDNSEVFISPRAQNLASVKGVDYTKIVGSGPEGRIIERDILAAIKAQPPMTKAAQASIPGATMPVDIPEQGSGIGGRVTRRDLTAQQASKSPHKQQSDVGRTSRVTETPLKGVRRVIADRMRNSLQESAQLTLNAYADARALLAYRKRLKEGGDALGLNNVTINDLIMFTVSRVLLDYPEINATLAKNVIRQYADVNLGFAVDTSRGLLVPVINQANHLSLKQLSEETSRLAEGAQNSRLLPDDMSGGTFTVTNLGALGIDTFTPVINPPQVAILGVGGISLRPVEVGGEVQFIKHLALSLTIDHQVVDGAPGARFLSALCQALTEVDLLTAL